MRNISIYEISSPHPPTSPKNKMRPWILYDISIGPFFFLSAVCLSPLSSPSSWALHLDVFHCTALRRPIHYTSDAEDRLEVLFEDLWSEFKLIGHGSHWAVVREKPRVGSRYISNRSVGNISPNDGGEDCGQREQAKRLKSVIENNKTEKSKAVQDRVPSRKQSNRTVVYVEQSPTK